MFDVHLMLAKAHITPSSRGFWYYGCADDSDKPRNHIIIYEIFLFAAEFVLNSTESKPSAIPGIIIFFQLS